MPLVTVRVVRTEIPPTVNKGIPGMPTNFNSLPSAARYHRSSLRLDSGTERNDLSGNEKMTVNLFCFVNLQIFVWTYIPNYLSMDSD